MLHAFRTTAAALGLVALVTMSGCGSSSTVLLPAKSTVQLGVPDRLNQTPGIAAEGSIVAVSWTAVNAESVADAYVAVSRDEGATFGSPVRVNDLPGEVRPSEQQAPRIAIHGDTIAVLWTARRESQTQVRFAVSKDQGRSFGASQMINPAGAPGTRGWGSLVIDQDQQIHALWLDTRVSSAPPPGKPAVPHVHGSGAKMETRQDVYEAIVGADGVIHERVVATGACFCCKTALVQQGGAVWGAWRDVYPGSLRDMTFARLTPGADVTRIRVSEDQWKIDGCPEDGPALAGTDSAIHLVWPTLVDDDPMTKGVFHASSADGQTFSARVRLDDATGSASHPVVAATRTGAVLAAWEVKEKDEHHVAMRAWSGADWQPVITVASGASASSPSVAAVSQGFLVAWGRRGASETVSVIELTRVSTVTR